MIASSQAAGPNGVPVAGVVVIDSKRENREITQDGKVIYKRTPLTPNDALPFLKQVDTITAHVTAPEKDGTGHESLTVPQQQHVYIQKAKSKLDQGFLVDDIFEQLARWFEHPARTSFVKELYIDAFQHLHNKPLALLLIDAQQRQPVVPFPTQVKKVKPKDFMNLEKCVGKQIRELRKLPDRLEDNWFPLMLLHRHIFDKGHLSKTPEERKRTEALQSITYTSFTILPFPDEETRWQSWPDATLQAFVVQFLRSPDSSKGPISK
jgi:hypothetical protein